MKYYIEISSWNLLESFVTESISPFSFYKDRNFGNNLSRYLSGNKEIVNHLILSTKDLGGDFSICIDGELIDDSVLMPRKKSKNIYTYPKTIYYRKGFVQFRFATPELRDTLITESQILLEVKCLEKYLPSFYVEKIESKEHENFAIIDNEISYNQPSYVNSDNSVNKIKGAIIGYIRGLFTSSDESNQLLQNELRALKNGLGGYHTEIIMSGTFKKNEGILPQINICKNLYTNQIECTNYFEVLIAQLSEVENLAEMRANLKNAQNYSSKGNGKKELLCQKTNIENKLTEIEQSYNIYEVRLELEDIKAQEKFNGQANGKSRQYFKKGSVEYDRKQFLKQKIEDFEKNNPEYKELIEQLHQLEENLNVDSNMYDSTISALFSRISDIINELIKKASSVTSRDEITLSNVHIDMNNVLLQNQTNNPELCYFNILLRMILQCVSTNQISEYAVLDLLVKSANTFKEDPLSKTNKGEIILNYLRIFWKYKHQESDQVLVPENDMPIFQSIFSFFVKPLGYEQMERYMLLKKFQQKAYAFMLWGAWIGFADMPKTFTNVLYQNENISRLIDDKLKELNNIQQ